MAFIGMVSDSEAFGPVAPIHDALHTVVYKSGISKYQSFRTPSFRRRGWLHSTLNDPRVAASADRAATKRINSTHIWNSTDGGK